MAMTELAADAATTAGAERKRYGKVTKRGVVWAYFREGIGGIIAVPTAVIMARLLTPFEFGIAAAAGIFLTLAMRLTNFGFNVALVRVKDLRPEHCSSVFMISLGIGLTAYAALVASTDLIAAFLRAPQVAEVLPIAALTFLINPFGTVPSALMTRNMQFSKSFTVSWVSDLTMAVSGIGLALAGFGFWSLVYSRVIADTVTAAMKIVLGRWMPSFRFSLPAARELFSFGSGMFVKRLLDYAANSVDSLVVGRLLGMTTLGLYDKAFTTMNKLIIRMNKGGPMVSFRVFALIHEDPERFRGAYRNVVLATSLVSYPLLIGLAAAAPQLIGVVYGEKWLPAVTPFQLLCVAGILKIGNEYAGMAAQASGRIWNQVWRQLAYAALVAVMVAIGGSRWGLAGAAAGVLGATLVMSVLMGWLLVRATTLPASVLIGAQVPGALAAVFVGAAVVLIRMALAGAAPAPWQVLISEAAAGALAYLLFLKFNRFRDVRRLIRDTAADLAPPLGRVVRLVV